MARPESQQLAGYFPSPQRLLPSFASIVKWPELSSSPLVLLDPCAGDGSAIQALRRLWAPIQAKSRWCSRMPIYACELEGERAAALRRNLNASTDVAYHADAFRLRPLDAQSSRAALLFLNPPYDQDRDCRRLEHRFLTRFSQHLHPGAGLLFYLVPYYALEPSADFLARNFLDLRVWRLPEPEFHGFRQVLLVGRRARRTLASSRSAPAILEWARNPDSLPVLPEQCAEPYLVEEDDELPFSLAYKIAPYDLTASLETYRPWQNEPLGTSFSARELLGARFETAMPPKPVHIALALSSGVFNGHPLEPNDPRHPRLLAKGIFDRELVPVSERTNDAGEVVSTVEVERPRLVLTVLRLDTYTFHVLQAGTVPAGGEDLSRWNAADLIAHYDRALARLLAQQFPALHDPSRSEHRITLPQLARKPFRAQAEAVQAALKLLARGVNPFLISEVGTGKTTMALATAGALLPENHARTQSELRRVGFPDKVPQVERMLVVCPPHLLKTWKDEAKAVLPDLTAQVIESPSDLLRPAQLFLLSRETAKLGYGYLGVAGRCPRCGAVLESDAATHASHRLRCEAVGRRPASSAARLAEHLAALLAPSCPDHPLIADLVAPGPLLRRWAEPARPLPIGRLLDYHDHFLHEVEALFHEADEDERATLLPIAKQLLRLDAALDTRSRALPRLEGLVAEASEAELFGPHAWVQSVLRRLKSRRADRPFLQDDERIRELLLVLSVLHSLAAWEEGRPCREPLYQAVARPRRYPLAQLIRRRHAHDFQLVILDEAHEFNNEGSAQAKAAHRLTGLPGVPTIVLTGSLMGGYASSLFSNFSALSPAFRAEFGRHERATFVNRYGFRKFLFTSSQGSSGPTRRGSHTDREVGSRTTLGEAPGLMPTFILRHLLPVSVLVHKADLDIELPSLTETPVPISVSDDDPMDLDLMAEYERLKRDLLDRIRSDRFDPKRSGRLLGALVELPSCLDRATDDLPPFEIRYPRQLGHGLVARMDAFPSYWRTPKERWLLHRVAELRRLGNKVIVFLRHTGTPELPLRILRLLREVTPRVAWLDVKKVPPARREEWIDENVLAQDVEVLVLNPSAVKTGLNNLVSFSAALWYEMDLSAYTYRQANGRLHRIGQTRPVAIEIPFYAGTAQELLFDLVAKKVSTSLRVDALDLQAALEAVGASQDDASARSTALSLGQAVYRQFEAAPRLVTAP